MTSGRPDIKPKTCGRSREAGVRAAAKRIAFFGTRPPAQEYAPNGRYALGKRTRKLASGASEMGQSTKSLRNSPLRAGEEPGGRSQPRGER